MVELCGESLQHRRRVWPLWSFWLCSSLLMLKVQLSGLMQQTDVLFGIHDSWYNPDSSSSFRPDRTCRRNFAPVRIL
ncbi:hypothetical protein K437DRAFT_277038 [Tilletiaria anomala UBC 951]|uniref:Secreted protein n=1 Tax=Tilletiaria anomala (strain ATCC 24038 / CBS 436.72 / UBC 951) TaxID=1037660 RepID=A0A066V7M1_TILAU|nr:uncharacterized protein K437DRAFT_277038 [Tilletiaria anomala UBC 951]KDN34734.1 hypothetical protein K437DRAFT_277038 [Tilletiaria anomala UBC 951]